MLERILLVEDSENDSLLLQRNLKHAGLDDPVFWLSDPLQACAYLAGHPPYGDRNQFPLPNIILLDMRLPRMSGIELLQWIKAQPTLNKVIVIMVSHLNDLRLIEQAYQCGAHSFLDKAGNVEEFKNFVRFAQGLSRIIRPPAHGSEEAQSRIA